jgi:hypothetical protein
VIICGRNRLRLPSRRTGTGNGSVSPHRQHRDRADGGMLKTDLSFATWEFIRLPLPVIFVVICRARELFSENGGKKKTRPSDQAASAIDNPS